MIYFALRSIPEYWLLLSLIRNQKSDNHVVSVVGGLAYLNAISKHTIYLNLYDIDIDTIQYSKLILSLINVSNSIEEFLSFKTSKKILFF